MKRDDGSYPEGLARKWGLPLSAKYQRLIATLRVRQDQTKRYGYSVPVWVSPDRLLEVVAEAIRLEGKIGKPVKHRSVGRYQSDYQNRRTAARNAWLRVAAYAINKAEQIDQRGQAANAELRDYWRRVDDADPKTPQAPTGSRAPVIEEVLPVGTELWDISRRKLWSLRGAVRVTDAFWRKHLVVSVPPQDTTTS